MIISIDRKFYEEQLLFETFFFPKMQISRDMLEKLILRELEPLYQKELQGGTANDANNILKLPLGAGVLICCSGHHSQSSSGLKPFSGSFRFLPSDFYRIRLDYCVL